jgi:hypothetical protein
MDLRSTWDDYGHAILRMWSSAINPSSVTLQIYDLQASKPSVNLSSSSRFGEEACTMLASRQAPADAGEKLRSVGRHAFPLVTARRWRELFVPPETNSLKSFRPRETYCEKEISLNLVEEGLKTLCAGSGDSQRNDARLVGEAAYIRAPMWGSNSRYLLD